MIDAIYNTVNAISNKEQRGSISPEKFNHLLNMAIHGIYNSYDIGKLINKQNRGFTTRGLNDAVKMKRERYQHFYKYDTMTLAANEYVLPADCNYLDSVTYAGREVQQCIDSREFNLLKRSLDFSATLDYPIYLRLSNTLRVFPVSIITELELYYIRKPLTAKWTYNVVNGVPLFNESVDDFADVDLHEAERNRVIINVLSQLGINLKEEDLQAYAELQKDKKTQQENII